MKKLGILLLLFFAGCSKDSYISLKETTQKLQEGAILLDVRTSEEYETFHIQDAISLPLDQLWRIDGITNDMNQTIIVYCQSGNRSQTAVQKLQKMGYTHVYDFGGITRWS